jgi:hypothetical protein
MRPVALAALVLAAVVSVAGQSRQTVVPFQVGETLTYDVSWSAYLVAGSATTRVQDRRGTPGGSAYYLVAEGRPIPLLARLYNLYYKMETLLDSATLLPQRGSLHAQEGSSLRTTSTRFDRPARRALFEVHGDLPERIELDVPPQVQDGLSAIYVLRAMTYTAGESITLPVVDEGTLYNVRVQALRSERQRVPAGEFTAWNLAISITDAEGRPAASNAAIWITTDARRLPIRIQAELPMGHFVLALRALN